MNHELIYKDPNDRGLTHHLTCVERHSKINAWSFISRETNEEKLLFVSDIRLEPPIPNIGDYDRKTIENICCETLGL